jgi:hypothetical protein
MNKTVSKFVNSTMALTLAIGFSLAASPSAQAADDCLPGFTLVGETCEKTYSHTEGAKSLTVPAGLGLFQFEVFGAAGGAGGLDGSSCAKSFGGKAGYLFVESENVSGKTIAFYPGSKGSDGASGAKASGGGLGGTSLVSDEFAGGKGGNAGNVGSSGGGGGGGAATVLDIGSDRYVAAGAGAGGGCANSSGGSTAGSTLENYTETTKGGDGLSTLGNPYSDGGGGGGGGGGILGGAGGLLYKSPQSNESAGYGGNAGTNTPAGNAVTISRYQAATTAGKIIVTYFPVLGTKSLAVLTNSPTKSNVIEFKVTLKSNREFTVDDIELSGSATTAMELKSTITSTKPNKAPYEYFFNVTTEDSSERISGTLVAKVFDVSSNPVVIDAVAPQATVSFEQPTLDQPSKAFKVVFNEPVQGLTVEDFSPAIGTAIDCQVTAVTGDGTTFLVSLANCSEGTFGIVLNANAVTDSLGNQGPSLSLNSGLFGKSVIKDTLAPQVTIKLQDGTQQTNVHVYDVRFNEDVNGVSKLSFKPSKGTATDCEIGNVVGSGKYFKVSLENCTDGTFGITLLARSAQDSSGNKGPLANVASALEEQSTKATRVSITPGELPETLAPIAVEKIFSTLDAETQDAVKEVGIYAPIPGAPVVNVETDLSNSTANERIQINSAQSVELGSSVKLTIRVSDEIAANSDVVAFLEVGSVWQYLGRASFEGNTAESSEFAVAKAGTYNLRIVIVGKNVATNMSISKVAGFGKGLSRFRSAVTSQETLLSPQLIDLTLQGIEGPNGAPKVVEPEVVEPEVPVVPEPEPTVPGAQTDENAPSQPYDALATPEGVKAVAEAVGTAVVVAGAVAGAVAAAAGGSGGGGSPRGGASGGPTESTQNTDSSEGEITTLDAEVESFTTARVSWGDRIPIFRLKALTFLDSFTHNLTVALAKFSPVISKIVNDGAYLRSIFGSMWLAAPITGVALAITALMQPSIELRPPTWELFLVIAVLGMFDAFSGMLATVIYSIGMISIYGISDLSDVRLMLGVLLLGFGPALIGVAFRAIRKQVETSFAYFWDRLADLAVLTFFISWSVSAMVATLPALAGRTLVVANHTAEFSLFLAIAIGVRILLEELAARGFSKRLDTINPTEVPGTSQLQKVISTALRLFIFIFVTAAFMGNVWQVWVGSIIFILPNILGWFSDRFPNSPLLWKILPQGVPALALTLIVSSLSAGVIGGWLEGNPEYPQYLFMLLPIPVFLIGLLGMFGREGRNGEERPIMKPKWRWVYRVGGIVMLALTMNLAGVLVI